MLLFEGNRVMLFRTALALMELYGTELCFPVFESDLCRIVGICSELNLFLFISSLK